MGSNKVRAQPGFCLQLRMVLWKNWLTKKRHPVITILELFIPLALFLVILCIRSSQHAVPIHTQYYKAQPLLSTGIIPVLQLFCTGDTAGSIYTYKNTRLESLLESLDKAAVQLEPVLAKMDFTDLPLNIDSALKLANKLDQHLQNTQGVHLGSLVTNVSAVKEGLTSQVGLPEATITSLFKSNLNTAKIIKELLESVDLSTLAKDPEDATKVVIDMLSLKSVRETMCSQSMDVLESFFLPSSTVDVVTLKSMMSEMCGLDDDQFNDMVNLILDNLDPDALKTQTGLGDVDLSSKDAQSLLSLLAVADTVGVEMSWLDKLSPFIDTCLAPEQTISEIGKTSTAHHVKTLWTTIQPFLCGFPEDAAGDDAASASSLSFNNDQQRVLDLLTGLLKRGPRILFTPNNTAVNSIIQQLNGTISMLGNITSYSKQWLKMMPNRGKWLNSSQHDLPNSYMSYLQQLDTVLSKMDNLACMWQQMVGGLSLDMFIGFETEKQLEHYFLHEQYRNNVTVLAGVVFENLGDVTTSGALPPHIRYKIRQNATINPPTNRIREPFWFPSPGSNNVFYYYFGFVWLQDAIERAIVTLQTGYTAVSPGTMLHRMPYPCWLWDQFVWLIQHIIPLCLMLSWVYTVAVLVQRIVYEKEKRLKEVMKVMGLSDRVHWCGWLITAGIQMTFTAIVLTCILHFGRILPYSNPWIVLLFLETFAVSSIAFSFLISSVFSKAKLAAACAGIFYFLTYVPYIYIAIREDVKGVAITATAKSFASLLSTAALGLGGKYFLFYEIEGTGVQWDNIGSSPREKDDFSLLHILLMMVVDTVVYFLLAWYIQNVLPGSYGIPKPWYFPFTSSYWCGGSPDHHLDMCNIKRLVGIHNKNKYTFVNDGDDVNNDSEIQSSTNVYWCGCQANCQCSFEKEDSNLQPGVVVCNLRKKYSSSNRPALDGLSMKLYKNQITAFLGHNGAGKTTTMNILTGLLPPSTGSATIYGRDVRTDMDTIRQDMGMCPQHNVLFDSLTVEEHIWFYSRLKGVPAREAHADVIRMLRDLSLQTKRSSLPSALSGGMQRKLSIAMAFVGGARTVILDEPTAGVDPYSRRAIWNLLTSYRKGRTILVSTHHLDEAEALGDRVLIVADGKLKCGGSPSFLKSALGDGHQLHITTDSHGGTDNSYKILETIKGVIPRAFTTHLSDSEIQVTLPLHKEERGLLVYLFRVLESSRDDLGIKSYDVSDSGLEQVFVKVTTGAQGDRRESSPDLSGQGMMSLSEPQANNSDDCELLQLTPTDDLPDIQTRHPPQCKLFTHVKAMLAKRLRYTQRNRKALFSQIVLPAVFVSISMTIALTAPDISDPEPRVLSTAQYYEATQPEGNFVPFSIHKPTGRRQQDFTRPSRQDIASTSRNDSQNNLTNSTQNHSNRVSKTSLTGLLTAEHLIRSFFLPSGLGATCVLNTGVNTTQTNLGQTQYTHLSSKAFNRDCSKFVSSKSDLKTALHLQSHYHHKHDLKNVDLYTSCKCKKDNVGLSCKNLDATPPPQWKLLGGDVIQNITSATSVEQYFLFTTDRYRLHRYGGFSFGLELPYVPKTSDEPSSLRKYLDMLAVKEINHVWYNAKGFHAMPTYLNVLNNAMLRAALPEHRGDPAQYGITLTNHPMKMTSDFMNSDYINGGTDVLMAIFIIVAMSFVPASFAVFLVHERAVKAKHLQLSSGLHPLTYWLTNYVWDMCNYILPGVCIIGILLAFQIQAYVGGGNFQAVVLLFLAYGWSITPMMYPASFTFTEPSVAYIFLIVANLFTGITCVVCSFMLRLFDFEQDLSSWSVFLGDLFLIFPNYCLGYGMMTIALNHYSNEYYQHVGKYEEVKDAMSWDVTGKKLVVMVIMGLVSLTFTLLCEYDFCCTNRIRALVKGKTRTDNNSDVDEDVEAERKKTLQQTDNNNSMLRLEHLTKVYKKFSRESVTAVNDLTLSVSKGECFGLLGVNGAGKTSTFRMLTGDLSPTWGDVKLLSDSMIQGGRWLQQNVGYCPQFDALFQELTPTEHLYLFARLRGIPDKHQAKVVRHSLSTLGLSRYKNQPAGELSGGTRRKLSTAIALIGQPPLVILDEPTSGMDPYTRRFLWNVIQKLVQQGTSVVFSSHSMEECETLCSRLSIMVKGKLCCLGTIQHLKNKFGNGYTITIVLDSDRDSRPIQQHIEHDLPSATLRYRGPCRLMYEMRLECSRLAEIFQTLEGIPSHLGVLDYSVNQNTLDNVFIKFATDEKNADDISAGEATATNSRDATPDHFNTRERTLNSSRETNHGYFSDDEPLIELTPHRARSTDDCLIDVL